MSEYAKQTWANTVVDSNSVSHSCHDHNNGSLLFRWGSVLDKSIDRRKLVSTAWSSNRVLLVGKCVVKTLLLLSQHWLSHPSAYPLINHTLISSQQPLLHLSNSYPIFTGDNNIHKQFTAPLVYAFHQTPHPGGSRYARLHHPMVIMNLINHYSCNPIGLQDSCSVLQVPC